MAVAVPGVNTSPRSNINEHFLSNIRNEKGRTKFEVELCSEGLLTLEKINNYLVMEYATPPGWTSLFNHPQKVIYDLSAHKYTILSTNSELMKALKAKGLFMGTMFPTVISKPRLSLFCHADCDTSSAINFAYGTTHVYQTKDGKIIKRDVETLRIIHDFGSFYMAASVASIYLSNMIFGFTDGSLHCVDVHSGKTLWTNKDSETPLVWSEVYGGSEGLVIVRREKPFADNSQIMIYGIEDSKLKHTFNAARFVKDENILYLIDTKNSKLDTFDLKTQKITKTINLEKIPHEHTIKQATYNNDRLIVLFSNHLCIWDISEGKILSTHLVDKTSSLLKNYPSLDAFVLGSASGHGFQDPYFLSFWKATTGEFIAKKVPAINEHIFSFGSCLVTKKPGKNLPIVSVMEYGASNSVKTVKT